ncbi:MAG TPA: hypothetical protein VGJ18_06525 [Gemmatimonadaceae bacterium]|jgi:uncharacterized membrane protein YjfL (UPF0719 family)
MRMPANPISAKLEKLKREGSREWQSRTQSVRRFLERLWRRETVAALFLALFKALALFALPFLVYVRASVSLYRHGANPWIAILASAILTSGIVSGLVILIARRFRRRARVPTVVKWAALPVVFTWCVYAAFYLSRVNVKSDDVRAYYSSVNPILRVALSTIVLVDPDLVVTDMGRVPHDYRRMHLPVNDRTKHYIQADGWVHAVDLRTRGRGVIRNRVVQLYFWSMGFSTLRHVGTADHLHVQL